MKNFKLPLWNLIAIIGGLLTFIGFFLNVFSYKSLFLFGTMEFGNGIDLLNEDNLTSFKILPLIIAIIAILLVLYAIADLLKTYKGDTMPISFIVVSIVSVVNLILAILVIVSISNKSMFEVLPEGTDIMIGVGPWMMLIGSIITIGSAIFAKFCPTVMIATDES